jgi:hypothetical protein
LQKAADDPQQAFVANAPGQTGHQDIVVDPVKRRHDRLPITKTFGFGPSSHANGIPLKGADFPSSRA